MNSLKSNNQGALHERKYASKHKKRHAHLDDVDMRTNIVNTSIKVKTEFDVKVEAKTEVKSDDIEGKKSVKNERCGIVEHVGCHYACFLRLCKQIKFVQVAFFKIKLESP